MILKLGMYCWGLKLYEVYINDDPGLTLTFFMARSNWVICTFEWENCYRAGRDDVTTGKLFPSRGECLGLYRCVLIIFKRK